MPVAHELRIAMPVCIAIRHQNVPREVQLEDPVLLHFMDHLIRVPSTWKFAVLQENVFAHSVRQKVLLATTVSNAIPAWFAASPELVPTLTQLSPATPTKTVPRPLHTPERAPAGSREPQLPKFAKCR